MVRITQILTEHKAKKSLTPEQAQEIQKKVKLDTLSEHLELTLSGRAVLKEILDFNG